ncbi:MAG: GFA family protein [Hyphomicrobiales bacterium]
MTDHKTLAGKCLCGAVEISGQANNLDVTVCHCDMCRRWSSGPYMEVTCENVAFNGEDNVGRVRSSDWAERGFCKQCGSNLFYHIVGSSDYQISTGLLDDQSRLRMKLQVFTDSKPSFYDFENNTKMMTGDEVIAAFTPSSG